MTDRIELVDGEYGQCVEERPARQIRTRLLSFQNIKAKFNSFRIAKLKDKLESKVEKALTQEYTDDNYEKKINKTAGVIARLEEKIMILSKQDVPKDYVSRRAIKLRQNMIENLTYHTSTYYHDLYTIGLEKRDIIMDVLDVNDEEVIRPVIDTPSKEEVVRPVIETPSKEEVIKPVIETPIRREVIKPVIETPTKEEVIKPVIETPVNTAAIPNNGEEIDVDSSDLDRKSIMEAINESFDQANVEDVQAVETSNEMTKDTPSTSADTTAIDKEAIRDAVEEAFRRLQATEKAPEDVSETTDAVRVSKNNATSVHVDQFDAEGNRVRRPKKYNYTPMTDEEIREAQIKLGFDEHGNIVVPKVPLEQVFVPADKSKVEAPVREVPVVVPERKGGDSLTLDDEPNMFDIIPQNGDTPQETVHSADSSRTMTIDDYESLKEKILALKKQQEESQQKKVEAQRHAQEIREQVQRSREQYEASQASYNEKMAKLRAYAASLEAACSENETVIAEVERESRESEGLVRSQEAETVRTNQIVSEIDSMMEDHPEIDNPAIKKA